MRGVRRQLLGMAVPLRRSAPTAPPVGECGRRTHWVIREEDYARAKHPLRPAHDGRKRPGREAGPRYSAGRARRGRGRFLPLIPSRQLSGRGQHHHERERAHGAFRRGREARGLRLTSSSRRQDRIARRGPHACGEGNQTTNKHTPVAAGIGRGQGEGFPRLQRAGG